MEGAWAALDTVDAFNEDLQLPPRHQRRARRLPVDIGFGDWLADSGDTADDGCDRALKQTLRALFARAAHVLLNDYDAVRAAGAASTVWPRLAAFGAVHAESELEAAE